MDLGVLVRLCAFPHDVAAPEPVRPCIRVLSRLRQRDAVFPRIHADRWTKSQAEHMGLSLAGNGVADHYWCTAVANLKSRRSRNCTTLSRSEPRNKLQVQSRESIHPFWQPRLNFPL